MTNDEINKYIHEKIMGKCWHDWSNDATGTADPNIYFCTKCPKTCDVYGFIDKSPNYCSDKSPRSLLNEVVAVVTITLEGWNHFHCALEASLTNNQMSWSASAEQIARACVAANRQNSKKNEEGANNVADK